MKASSFLPYTRQWIDDDDITAVTRALKGDLLTTGPILTEFEDTFAKTVGAAHTVACTSGTAGLHLGLLAANIGAGDVVIVPAITFVATANAARFVGAEVVFSDVDPDTGLMGPEHLQDALKRANGKARAVIPVHLAGQSCPMADIMAVAEKHNLIVIEDACHALGGRVDGGPVGDCAHSHMAVFSLHPAKIITMGEGGLVSTNDPTLADRLHRAKAHGVERSSDAFRNKARAVSADGEPNPWYHEFPEVGFNYRPDEMNCALGLSQLSKLDKIVTRREALIERYRDRLASLAPLASPIHRTAMERIGWHLSVVLIDFDAAGRTRASVMNALKADGIGTQVHYIPVYAQPYYTERYGEQSLPGAETYYARALALPLYSQLQDSDVDRVVDALGRALGV